MFPTCRDSSPYDLSRTQTVLKCTILVKVSKIIMFLIFQTLVLFRLFIPPMYSLEWQRRSNAETACVGCHAAMTTVPPPLRPHLCSFWPIFFYYYCVICCFYILLDYFFPLCSYNSCERSHHPAQGKVTIWWRRKGENNNIWPQVLLCAFWFQSVN